MDILGAKVVDEGINFAVYSENATRIEVLLFNDPRSGPPKARIPLTKSSSNVWTVHVAGLGVGQHYGYVAWGPNWPYQEDFSPGSDIGYITDCDDAGNRFNPNKLLIDPYTRRIHRDFDWTKGNAGSGNKRNVSSWGAAAKSVVITSDYVWSDAETAWRENRMKGDAFQGHKQSDLLRSFRVLPKAGLRQCPGTFKGVGERQILERTGITAELMPVMKSPKWHILVTTHWRFLSRTAVCRPKQQGTKTWTSSRPWSKLRLKASGYLDVVYNHTGEGGF